MGSEIRDFLEMEKPDLDTMQEGALQSEVAAWRLIMGLLPREVMMWAARLNDVVRLTKRNYQGSTGLLLDFKLEATEFTIGLTEAAWDTLHGKRVIEDKVLVIPAAAIMFVEFVGDTQDYDPLQAEDDLAKTSLEV